MALLFSGADTHRVNCGSGGSLDDINPFTWWFWLNHDGSTSSDGRIAAKDHKNLRETGTTKQQRLVVARATGTDNTTSNHTITQDQWEFGAVTYSTTSPGVHYHGTLSTVVVASGETTNATGSGAVNSDAAGALIIGNRSNADREFNGHIAVFGFEDKELSLDELAMVQFNPGYSLTSNVSWWMLGFPGTGTQRDWSSNSNDGTVTGATETDHVPLNHPFWRPTLGILTAAAASTVPPLFYHHRHHNLAG